MIFVNSYSFSGFLNQYSLDFDGVDERVEITDHNDFSFTDGAGTDQPFSISAWVKADSFPFRIVTKGTNVAYEYAFYITGTSLLTMNVAQNSGQFIGRQYSSALSTGTWYHVVATYDASEVNGGLSLYLNGSAVDNTNSSAGVYTGMPNTASNVYIGGWAGVDYANGKIDEVSFWDKELSVAEVLEIYNSGSPSDLSAHSAVGNIITWLRNGDGDTSPTILDQIGAHNGTMTNMEAGDIQTDVP